MTVRSYDFVVGPETDTLPTSGVVDSIFVSTKSADYTVTDTDNIGTILVDDTSSNRTITLPTAADNTDRKLLVINTSSDGGTVTVDGEGAETIDGQTTVVIYNQYDGVYLQCDGSSWYSVGEIPIYQIQDYTTISSVGSASQQAAGHVGITDILGSGTDIAYYKFANGALTTDEEGTYTLTNNNSVTNTAGIDGSDFAISLNASSQFMSQATLLDTVPTSIGIELWFKSSDGQPASAQYLVNKENIASEDRLRLYIDTTGIIYFLTEENNNGNNNISSSTVLANGSNPWHHLIATWDTTNGKRLWIDGVLESQDSGETTLMNNGTAEDFAIGAGATGTGYFGSTIGTVRVFDKVITQKEADLLYSVRYDKPAIFNDTSYKIEAFIQKDGSSSFERPYVWDEVKRDSSYIYRSGFTSGYGLSSSDKLKIIGRR